MFFECASDGPAFETYASFWNAPLLKSVPWPLTFVFPKFEPIRFFKILIVQHSSGVSPIIRLSFSRRPRIVERGLGELWQSRADMTRVRDFNYLPNCGSLLFIENLRLLFSRTGQMSVRGNSNLKNLYMTRAALQSRLCAPILTQSQMLKLGKPNYN